MNSSGHWPRWATVRADQVRTELPPEEWGPWAQGGDCSRSIPSVHGLVGNSHPSEPPWFFHCNSCLTGVRSGEEVPQPDERRDSGLCIRCSEPAAQPGVGFTHSAFCQQAEAKGTTVARLRTGKWCPRCDPYSLPFCAAKVCPKKRKRHRADLTCSSPIRHAVPHCTAACEARKQTDAAYDRLRRTKPPHRTKTESLRGKPPAS